MADVTVDDSSFVRAAGKQLLVYAALTVLGFAAIMIGLDAMASLVGSDTGSTKAVDPATKTITLLLKDEPPQLDSTRATDQVSGQILGHVMEGLLREDAQHKIQAGVAERWEISSDGATFHLRADALWSDGKPVRAHDFVFSWRTVVDPKTASEYAFIMYFVKNAEAINQGKLPVTELGVTAVDDRTLSVVFERPMTFFDKVVTFKTFLPIREDFYRQTNGRYGADADEMLYNGPFRITSWVHGASLKVEKNDHYWRRDEIRLNTINWAYVTSDANASFNFFKDGKIAAASLSPDTVANALEQRWQIKQFQDGGVFFLEFNHRPDRLTRNLNLRKAMQLVNDPSEVVNKVTKLPGYLVSDSLFPVYLDGVRDRFKVEKPPKPIIRDLDAARQHLELAKRELGLEAIPPLTLLTTEDPISNVQAEYYQALFRDTLGIEIKIDKQIFKQRLAKMTAGEFDLVSAGWGPDYEDLLTYGDLFASWNLNNRGRYASAEYDRQVRVALNSTDQAERVEAFAKMQDLIIDDAVILFNYERGASYVTHPQLKGIVRRVIGSDPDYTYAWIDEGQG
jgi:oligopeptide transport system substrate-binding protein